MPPTENLPVYCPSIPILKSLIATALMPKNTPKFCFSFRVAEPFAKRLPNGASTFTSFRYICKWAVVHTEIVFLDLGCQAHAPVPGVLHRKSSRSTSGGYCIAIV